ncbi:isoflavone reductase family protein [Sodiomyces alkalinus F11]|uniref:Isoflavone reductase family protein n=1 Tax=Sodiomyces alkalinus (strain CBS 110278 / VKM F-3762 / F11) TaxID=1314773 RepID=A0A3N2PTQ0_SODAK|nr:isoflavone reductase family protein [Sodiomyces alkalinus F11]ROT37814.1 isoflavone reductase family protein [Sodiomyces alkalinus F11]
MSIKNVALVGANGSLGSVLLSSLVNSGAFTITAIIRPSSSFTSPYPASQVRVAHTDDALSSASLQEVLAGQDAVIAAFRYHDPDAHIRLVEAAALAGARVFIPADFGSIDADHPRARQLVPLYNHKLAVRRRAQELAEEFAPRFTWTGIVCGHFFEWGVREGHFRADLARRVADVLDGGEHRASTTTLARLGEAVVRILELSQGEGGGPSSEAIRNKTLFLQSFCISQNELVRALERATGSTWDVNPLDSEEFIRESKRRVDEGGKEAVEDVVFALGALYSDWTRREDFRITMETLGFEDEDLDEALAAALRG